MNIWHFIDQPMVVIMPRDTPDCLFYLKLQPFVLNAVSQTARLFQLPAANDHVQHAKKYSVAQLPSRYVLVFSSLTSDWSLLASRDEQETKNSQHICVNIWATKIFREKHKHKLVF